jgi:hypothetical protein
VSRAAGEMLEAHGVFGEIRLRLKRDAPPLQTIIGA